ncbi:MAG: NAD/NADP octopine/nopaline dehydrogenase family protein [Candidatus Ancaeobacter aquaticus]|nr:NAD/NADP octopine/nopaline dehydrogenase family protein [Candidatus Ancaeobacter aquaticus]
MAKKITILGAGNGGHAIAFDTALNGAEVMLFEHPNFTKNLDGIREKGGIEAVDALHEEGIDVPAALSGFVKIAGLTSDPKEAMDFADVIVMVVPSFAQATIFEMVMPHLRDGQTFVILPGNFASLLFKKMMAESGISANVTFAETVSIPYAVRIIGPGQIFIMGKKTAFSLASLPGSAINDVCQTLKDVLLLKLIPLANVIEAGFSNPNMIIHVPTATLNMGAMESREGKIQFYREGASDTVSKVLEKMDSERVEIGAALGLKLITFYEAVNTFYSLDMKSIRDFTLNTPIHNNMPNDSPKSPKERYITEDCPFLLVPVHEFAQLVNVPCPAIESIIKIDNIYNDTDYFKVGRTLDVIGLKGMSPEEIIAHVS